MFNIPYVYAITDGRHIKIGVARNPHKRLKELSTGNASRLTLLGYFSGGFALEAELHTKFEKVRENGEWMYASEGLVAYLNDNIPTKLILVQEGKVFHYNKYKMN